MRVRPSTMTMTFFDVVAVLVLSLSSLWLNVLHVVDAVDPSATTMTTVHDTIIIGGGWSGLATARALQDNQLNILLLEARDYLGGRSRTQIGVLHPAVPTELGSAWIYQGTAVADQFNDIGLNWIPNWFSSSSQGLYSTVSGLLSSNDAENIRRRVIEEDFVPYIASNSSPDISLQRLIDNYFEDRGQSLSDEDRQLVLAMTNSAVHSEYTSALNEIQSSYVANDYTWEYRIDFVGVPGGGFSQAVNHYAAPLLEGSATSSSNQPIIKLQTKVTEIDYDYRYNDDSGSEFSIVRVTAIDLVTESSNVYFARTVVCTVPLGVLKFGDIIFQPTLSEEKTRAIEQMGMGNANKCYLYWDAQIFGTEFIESWWPRGQLDFQLITPDNESSYDWTYFINDHESYSDTDYYILSAWNGGLAADRWEQQSDDAIVAKVVENLQLMLGEPAGVLIPTPSKTLITRWRSDPYARGAYTFHAVGVDMESSRQALGRRSGNLFWAGEATLDGMTTVVAYQSGQRAANEVLSSGLLDGDLPPIPSVQSPASTSSPTDVPTPALTVAPVPLTIAPVKVPTNSPTEATSSPFSPTSFPPTLAAATPLDPCETEKLSVQSCFVDYPDILSTCRTCLVDFGVGYASQSFTNDSQCQSLGLSCQVFVPTCRTICQADNPDVGQQCWPLVHAYNACLVLQVCANLDMGQCPLDFGSFLLRQTRFDKSSTRSGAIEQNRLRGQNRGLP